MGLLKHLVRGEHQGLGDRQHMAVVEQRPHRLHDLILTVSDVHQALHQVEGASFETPRTRGILLGILLRILLRILLLGIFDIRGASDVDILKSWENRKNLEILNREALEIRKILDLRIRHLAEFFHLQKKTI